MSDSTTVADRDDRFGSDRRSPEEPPTPRVGIPRRGDVATALSGRPLQVRTLPLLAAVAALVLVTAGCTSSDSSDTTGTPDADATVTVGLVLEPTDLDIRRTAGIALDQVLIDNVYQGLVGRTQDNEIVDVLAASHTVSSDGLTYTFTLADGVTFHDGAALTADDVVWSLQQVADDDTLANHSDLAAVDTISSPDPSTVVLTLSQPDSALLFALTGRAGLVLQEDADNDLSTSANGTGPFTLASWTQGDNLQLSRYDDYWGSPASVAGVVFRYIPDASARMNASISGDIDVQTAVDATLRSQLDGVDGITVDEGRTTDKYTLAFNNAVAPFTDPRVRKAIRLAVDNDALITATGGSAVDQGGPIPELDPGYADLTSVDAYDPDAARELLDEAGQSDLDLTLEYANVYPAAIGDVLTTQLAAVGITLTVEQVDFSTWLSDVFVAPSDGSTRDFQLSMVNHAETHDFGNWANPDYYWGYDSPDVQALYADSLAATDPAEAAADLAEAAEIVSEDAPAEWLYTSTTLTAVRDGVTGFPTSSTTTRLDLSSLAATE
ncbi:ABC transporter substrate-binding protein [Frigoribacterium faeni]|uniref:ABC transporter substrate-binding protein n=1 Tax=Frigoribacterium faeni TaxID=145483 RepID=A0A7W3JGS3_9MICO|nr:ABC transporter substrate-binding protein [Frigoribacterium faeni]MBA8812524.1 peptide/nickel transport system substrate-binding protein [Frigoribacterium faeni]GEK81759.1 ABC transporter substrate-binding protein [Frigoribacterium faeni]